MRSLTRHVIAALLLLAIGLTTTAHAEVVSIDEAQQVADNFVQMMIVKKGVWAGRTDARAGTMVPFTRGDRLLGYLCPVEPVGYVLVAAYREMEPIRAYSMRSTLDPDDDTGLADVLKALQEGVLNTAEMHLGRSLGLDDDFHSLMDVDSRGMWARYLDPDFNPQAFREPPVPPAAGIAYQEGDTLLTTTWNQCPPYNDQCPDLGCSWAYCDFCNTNAWAGCGATAGAQICRYYNWPPRGSGSGYLHPYDWPNMPERMAYHTSQGFTSRWGGNWYLTTQDEIDAVALVSERLGSAMESIYGCDGTSTLTVDVEAGLDDHFRFSDDAETTNRDFTPYATWVNLLVTNLDASCPVIYRIPDHFVIIDGYEETAGSYTFHVVYGHGGSNDGWFGISGIPGGLPTDEHAVISSLYPEYTLYDASGYLAVPSFPYRYLSLDVYVADLDLEFAPGHSLQVRAPGLLFENTDTGAGAELTLSGTPGNETVIFQQGDPAGKTRIVIHDAEIQVHEGGQMVIH